MREIVCMRERPRETHRQWEGIVPRQITLQSGEGSTGDDSRGRRLVGKEDSIDAQVLEVKERLQLLLADALSRRPVSCRDKVTKLTFTILYSA